MIIYHYPVILAMLFLVSCDNNTDPETLFKMGKYESAYGKWFPLAENNDLKALNYIGIHYYLGLGTRKDYKKAREWFEKAATQGYPDAQFNLGLLYEKGLGVENDYNMAFMWFFAAYEQGNDNALNHMKDIAQSHKLMPNQMTYATRLAEPYIFNRVERKEKAPTKNY